MASYNGDRAPPVSSGGFKIKLKMNSSAAPSQPAAPALAPPPAVAPVQQPAPAAAPAPLQQQSAPIAKPPPAPAPAPVPPRQPTAAAAAPAPAPAMSTSVPSTSATSAASKQALVSDVQTVKEEPVEEDDPVDAKEARGVSSRKYRELKRKYNEVTEDKDSTTLSLHRAQKLILRLREEKGSLLDRVLALESAAGLTSAEVEAAEQGETQSALAETFLLLHPPTLPSLADRPRRPPTLTTASDMSSASYNEPIDPPHKPASLPPRQRSKHLISEMAADKLREDEEARRTAQGLPRLNFSAVALLGVDGSNIADNVERALSGEQFGVVSAATVPPEAEPESRATASRKTSSKRRRESTTPAPPVRESLQGLPNPFEVALPAPVKQRTPSPSPPPAPPAAVEQVSAPLPLPAPPAPAPVEVKTAPSPAPASTYPLPAPPPLPLPVPSAISPAQTQHGYPSQSAYVPQQYPSQTSYYDAEMSDDGRSLGSGAYSEDDGGDYGHNPGSKKARRSNSAGGPRKPKRQKVQTATPGTHTIPHIPRNPDGSPRLPLQVGTMLLKNVGTISSYEGFHNDRYIFPVGYEASRNYPSMIKRADTVEYICRIVDSGDGPRFELYAADQPGTIISGTTPTGAWSQVVKAANRIRERNHTNSVSGPDYFGLSHNVVKALIQELPGAQECEEYIWQTFIEDAPTSSSKSGSKKSGSSHKRKSETRYGSPQQPQMSYPQQQQYMPHNGAHYNSHTGLPMLPHAQAYSSVYDDGADSSRGVNSPTAYGGGGQHGNYGSPNLPYPNVLHSAPPSQYDQYNLPPQAAPPVVDAYALPAASADAYALPPAVYDSSTNDDSALDPAFM